VRARRPRWPSLRHLALSLSSQGPGLDLADALAATRKTSGRVGSWDRFMSPVVGWGRNSLTKSFVYSALSQELLSPVLGGAIWLLNRLPCYRELFDRGAENLGSSVGGGPASVLPWVGRYSALPGDPGGGLGRSLGEIRSFFEIYCAACQYLIFKSGLVRTENL
jgi:hypothetical protein